MTKKELEQLIPLRREIKDLKERIEKAPVHTSVQGSDANFPYVLHNVVIEGLPDEALQDKLRLSKCVTEYERLYDFINGIEDSLTRQIFRKKFNYGFSCQRIASDLDYIDEGTPRKIIKKFLELSENSEKSVI